MQGFLVSIACAICFQTSLCSVHHEEWLNLTAWWNAVKICHACKLRKDNWVRVPNPLKNVGRRDLDDFVRNAMGNQKSFLSKENVGIMGFLLAFPTRFS